jgi:hypothetical protein
MLIATIITTLTLSLPVASPAEDLRYDADAPAAAAIAEPLSDAFVWSPDHSLITATLADDQIDGHVRPDEFVRAALESSGANDVRFTDGRRVKPSAGFTHAGEYTIACTIEGRALRGQVTCNVANPASPIERGHAVLTLEASSD